MRLGGQVANAMTGCRILCSILMLFPPVSSIQFCTLYLLCGFTDMADGAVARRTNSASEFGARFDTVADMVFVISALIKFLPMIHIPTWLWIWVIAIAVIRVGSITWGFVLERRMMSVHTVLNKITGASLFLLPFTLNSIEPAYSISVICVIATLSAVQEGYYIGTGREVV